MKMLEANVIYDPREEPIGVEIKMDNGTRVGFSLQRRCFAVAYPDRDSSSATNISPFSFSRKFHQSFRLEVQKGLEKAREEIYQLTESQKGAVVAALCRAELATA